MRWLITGGCGFIGRNLIHHLQAEGDHFIRTIDNLKVGTREDLSKVCAFNESAAADIALPTAISSGVELVVGDIMDPELAIRACNGFHLIVHLAANTGVAPSLKDPRIDCECNVIGTLNYLEAARQSGIRRFVFASSGAPVGEVQPPIHEELPPHPVSPYGASKLAGEGYCSAYCRSFDVETVCLRFSNVYGPLSGKKDSVIAKFIKRAMEGKALEIYGDGMQTRDFIFVKDLVRAIQAAAEKEGVGGETFQIATSRETTVGEMVEMLLPILEEHGIENVPLTYTERLNGDVMRNFCNVTKAREMLGWECRYELPAGLARTVDWFIEQRDEFQQ